MHILELASGLDVFGMVVLRVGLVVVLLWIGALKFASYEADSIVPMVVNSPFLRFVYRFRAPAYRDHMNKEGELVPEHRQWHRENGTYWFSKALGVVIITIGILIALYPIWPTASAFGSFLLIGMCFSTLSFLLTTPEAWVPPLGDPAHGFPFLSGVGRLVVKDVIMLGAAIVTLADAAKAALR